MKNQACKLLILFICFFVHSLYAVPGDTIRYYDVHRVAFAIKATHGKQFTVRCVEKGIKETFIGEGIENPVPQTIGIQFPLPNSLVPSEITIEGEEGCEFTDFRVIQTANIVDLSRCPSIKFVSAGSHSEHNRNLEILDLSNCKNVEQLWVHGGRLRELDLSDKKVLERITCAYNNLSALDINLTNNPAIWWIYCSHNHLPLSNLYALSELIENIWNKAFDLQTLGYRRILLGDTIDYSSQKEFGDMATNFYLLRGTNTWGAEPNSNYALPSDYTLEDGIFTFHRAGKYTLDMRNPAITQHPFWDPARVLVWIDVVDFVPVTWIKNVPETIIAGIQVRLDDREVLPDNATYTTITWSIVDTGTTGATLTGSRLNTTAPGFVKVTATIKDGLAFDEDYTQDFVIEVKALGVDESEQGLSKINIYPNPTTGKLIIESGDLLISKIEVLDIEGRVVSSHHLTYSPTIDISHLNSGAYFVRVTTEQGEIVKKVVKQ